MGSEQTGVDENGDPIFEEKWVEQGYDDGQGNTYSGGQLSYPTDPGLTDPAMEGLYTQNADGTWSATAGNPTDQRLTTGTQASPGFDWGSVLTGGNWDWAKLAAKGLTLAAAVQAYNQAKNPPQTGYQGGIPNFTAVRAQVPTATTARPGAGGQRYFSDTAFALPATAATASGLPAAQTAATNQAATLGTQNKTVAALQQAQQPAALTPAQTQAQQDQFYGRTPAPVVPVQAAQGGLMGLARGGQPNAPRYLQGNTDGMADKIPARIDGQQEAALAHGEFVVPADVVSHLGNGNSDAGADVLYKMMDKIRKARTGTTKQGRQIDPNKFTPGGLAYAAGGAVQHFDGLTGSTVNPTGTVGTESNLSNWVGPYVTDMLGKGQALSQQPYQAYQGPLTAGDSALQTQAYGLAGGLQTPASIGQAATTAGTVAQSAGNLNYNPTQATNQFTAPANTGYAATTAAGATGSFTPGLQNYQMGPVANITSQQFTDPGVAASYMNPYLQQSLAPQLQEARRQSQITQQANNAQATQAGAFGGARQGILAAENQRNLGSNLANLTGQGYNTAYNTGQTQFNADQSRSQAAQQANQQAGLTVGQQNLQANLGVQSLGAGLNSQWGMQNLANQQQAALANQAAQNQAAQFGATQNMTAAQQAAQYGQQAQAQNAQEAQFGANYGLQGLNTQLQAAQAQGQLGVQQNQAGLANLNEIANLGATQQATAQAGIAADQAAFNAERDNPYKMVQYQQSLLQGLPLAAQSYNIQTNPYSAAANVLSAAGAIPATTA